MRELASSLPDGDGVGCFNTMYLQVTEAVAAQLDAGNFADPVFMDRLDVNFANLYLDAYARHTSDDSSAVCSSWRALFDRRSDDRVQPLQFALAGMNAHINHDLPIAVTMTARELGRPPTSGGIYEDFVAVNNVLADADNAVRERLQGPIVSALDSVCGPLDDALSSWGIARARAAAWRQALRLWEALDEPERYQRLLNAIDRLVAAAGTCLLTPVADADAAHPVLERAFDALDRFSDGVGSLLWGDGNFDGDDDGVFGTLVRAMRD